MLRLEEKEDEEVVHDAPESVECEATCPFLPYSDKKKKTTSAKAVFELILKTQRRGLSKPRTHKRRRW